MYRHTCTDRRGIYSTTRKDDKRFQLTVRINREKLAGACDLSGTDRSARERITGWKEREGGREIKRERGSRRNLSRVWLWAEGKVGPAHRMGIDTSAGP